MGTCNLAVRLGLKRLSGVVGVSQRFELAYPKAELEGLRFSGLQVVPTTFQPLQGQPVRRVITTVCPLAFILRRN
ncbi:hypothetical protein DA798_11820 [Lactobacillus sp. PFC-70]|nr:hypothetical protein DA798_11820 [Lactobacillus sp. PFC-70]